MEVQTDLSCDFDQRGTQGVNFTAYQEFKKAMLKFQPQFAEKGELPSYQTLVLGLVSGAMGPCSNAPIDTSELLSALSSSS